MFSSERHRAKQCQGSPLYRTHTIAVVLQYTTTRKSSSSGHKETTREFVEQRPFRKMEGDTPFACRERTISFHTQAGCLS